MDIDARSFIRFNEAIVVRSILNEPAVRTLIDFGAEYSRNDVLDDLNDSGGMDDHKVDAIAAGGRDVAARFLGGSATAGGGDTVVEGDGGVEAGRGNANNAHIVIHFNSRVDASVVVGDVTGDLRLQRGIRLFADEKDASFVGDFRIAHNLLRSRDESRNVGRANGDVRVGGVARVGRVFRKTIINFRWKSLVSNRPFGLLRITTQIRLYLHPLYAELTTSGDFPLLPRGIVVEPYL